MNTSPPDPNLPGSVIDYPVDDMTITVQADLTFGQLSSVLARNRQQLPIDAADSQTVGELVMHDVAGPRQYGCGTLRDYVIGIEALDGHGRRFHAGGRVVKNVAGYDLCRLLVGSRGLLGTVTAVTFKVRPLPPSTAILTAALPDIRQLAAALDRLNTSTTTPVILDVLSGAAAARLLDAAFPEHAAAGTSHSIAAAAAHLVIGFEGPADACRWQLNAVTTEIAPFSIHQQPIQQPTASAAWCSSAQLAAVPDHNTAWLGRFTVLPSKVPAALEKAAVLGCEIFGRAGNGVLFLCPAAGRNVSESTAFQELQSLLTVNSGSWQVLKGDPAFNTRATPKVQQLSAALQQALATSAST